MVGRTDPPCSRAGRWTERLLFTALTVEDGKGEYQRQDLSTGVFIRCVIVLGVYLRYPPPS